LRREPLVAAFVAALDRDLRNPHSWRCRMATIY
jgi:hypothetical protein